MGKPAILWVICWVIFASSFAFLRICGLDLQCQSVSPCFGEIITLTDIQTAHRRQIPGLSGILSGSASHLQGNVDGVPT